MPEGPDFDFGAGAILTDLPGSGGQVIITGDKGGSVFSLDPATGATGPRRSASAGSWAGSTGAWRLDAGASIAVLADPFRKLGPAGRRPSSGACWRRFSL